jgi:predicted nucleotidyltransferase
MSQHELISYAYDFVSQLMDKQELFKAIRRIVLFGSVVRGDYTEQSDVDLFIDVESAAPKMQLLVNKELSKFEIKCKKTWYLRKISLPIKAMVGDLEGEEWKELRNEIASYGKLLYGRYEQAPSELKQKLLLSYDLKKISQKRKMSFLRKLYGYSLKKGKRTYTSSGILAPNSYERIAQGVITSPEEWSKIKSLLKSHHVTYTIREEWVK